MLRKRTKTTVIPYAMIIAMALSVIPAEAKPVALHCIAPQSSLYFTVTFDEGTGVVLFEGLSTISSSIHRDRIIFTMEGRDVNYGYMIDRMTGAMLVIDQKTGISQNSSCKPVKPLF